MCDRSTINEEVEAFNKQKLKVTTTDEKNTLPTVDDIEREKKECAKDKPPAKPPAKPST